MKPRWINIPPGPPEDPPPGPPDFIPEGRYLLEVESLEEKRSHVSQGLYYLVRCKVLADYHPDFRVHMVLPLTAAGLWRTAEFIKAVTGVRPCGMLLFNPDDYIDAKFHADLRIEHYENKQMNRVGDLHFIP